ncbi:MAG: hypothetical protein QHI48_10875 [Bacteroidota bacterium]|nr:hypothetical protein [Bacteroidota bacterium]
MRAVLRLFVSAAFLPFLFASPDAAAQTLSDWDTLWIVYPAYSSTSRYFWMGVRDRQYTGLAYDRFRDVLYVVNPDLRNENGRWVPNPRIHIWDAKTGAYADSIGRTAWGSGGELPVPQDTVFGGYQEDRFCIYRVDVDDEGRIYACNLVSPLIESPLPPCPGQDTLQGPWKVYRWDTPSATPKCIYATLDAFHTGVSFSKYNSEMRWTRWGDAFEVVGKRGREPGKPGEPPLVVDSARIMVSGGNWCLQPETNREVDIFLEDRRPSRPFEFRLAVRMVSSLEGVASHGLAPTGPEPYADIWMDNNFRIVLLNNQVQTAAPWPQTNPFTRNLGLQEDSATGTGPSGPIAFIPLPHLSRSFLVCADGRPTDPSDPTAPNWNTTARLVDVTNPAQPFRFLGSTPPLGYNAMHVNAGIDGFNYIADVDYKLEPTIDSIPGVYITLFVLMSNNGIGAFRTRRPLVIPVKLVSFTAHADPEFVSLSWVTASEVFNAGFDLQRSYDGGRRWESIAFLAGRGSERRGRAYAFRDPVTETHRVLKTVHYRLRQMDFDGRENHYGPLAVTIPLDRSSVELEDPYPRPAGSIATVRYRLADPSFVSLELLDMVGQRVAVLEEGSREAGLHHAGFDVSALPAGAYAVRLTAGRTTMHRMLHVMHR